MASANVEVAPQPVVLHIHMSQEEAERLKALFQNPLEQDEAKALRDVREAVWHALNNAHVN